jgi:hypothetical protein
MAWLHGLAARLGCSAWLRGFASCLHTYGCCSSKRNPKNDFFSFSTQSIHKYEGFNFFSFSGIDRNKKKKKFGCVGLFVLITCCEK